MTTTRLLLALSLSLVTGAVHAQGYRPTQTVGRWNIGKGGTVNVPMHGSTTFTVPTNIANYNFGKTGASNLTIHGAYLGSTVSRVNNGGTTTFTIKAK